MSIYVGTHPELQPDTRPIDRNPTIACEHCGESWGYQDYWHGRWSLDGQSHVTVCDECLKRLDDWHNRMVQNRSLSEFAPGDGA
jgi:hypothetical protein